jgi:hypothetical protein
LFFLFISHNDAQEQGVSLAQNRYLGQEPPGKYPEVFAPGIISTGDNIEFKIAISPNGNEFYFTRQEGRLRKIYVVRRTADGWAVPQPASFSGRFMDEYPTISPDGQRIFFQSTRPLPDSVNKAAFRRGFLFWTAVRTGDDWGAPEPLDAAVNIGICLSTVTSDGTIYFSSSSPPVIMKSYWQEGAYSDPVKLAPPINDGTYGSNAACLSPGKDFIIFASGRPGFGKSDLWISFKNNDGSWAEPENLGSPINTASGESGPVMSPDGKYLFFGRDGDIYWVETDIIDNFKPQEIKSGEKP